MEQQQPTPGAGTNSEREIRRLADLARELKLADDDLDDDVIDTRSSGTSAINNGGFDRQVSYLVAKLGAKEVEGIIRGAVQPADETTTREG